MSCFGLTHVTDVQLGSLWFSQLEDWWLDSAYLESRIPSQVNVNFGGPAPYLEHCWPPAEGVSLERTSIVTWLTLKYWNLLHT